ncbi:mucin-4-like [Saccostrea cucullata]|uniref:mucin-4-like n=1 Tax=Saccostrea cuccullata TaxID=36930 RepID=UPI002ED3D70E
MATNMKLMQEISDQFLHCKICLEPYKSPKTLTCLHTFCSECIQQHVDSENTRSRYSLYNRHVTCPLCRKRTEIPTGGVRRLPDNFLLANLTEVIDRKRPLKIPPCEICHTVRPRSNDACSKCLDCSKLLCKACVELHLTTKVTQNHSLIDVEGEKDIECKVHPDEIVRFYCEPCDACICVVCTFQEHRDHEICSFNEGYSKYKSSMESLLNNCRSRYEVVQDRISIMNQCETILKETRENIRDLAISYIQQVRSTEKELLKEVESYFGENIMSFLENKDWLQENLDGLQNACNLTDIIMRDKGVEMLLLKKEMQNKLVSLLEPTLPEPPEDVTNFTTKIRFVPGGIKFGKITFNGNSDENENSEYSMDLQKNSFGCQTDDSANEEWAKRSKESSIQSFSETGSVASEMEISYTSEVTNYYGHKMGSQSSLRSLTPVPTVDACMQTFSNVGSKGSGICVKCCQDLQSEVNIASSNFNTAPCVQDVIVLDSAEGNPKEWRRRRRSLIRSRRVQTDLSMSNESVDEMSLSVPNLRHIPERSLSCGAMTGMPQRETRTIALDPIILECINEKKHKISTRDTTTMTTMEMKPVVPTRNASTVTNSPRTRDSEMQTKVENKTCDTQTPKVIQSTKKIGTDYAGQTDKSTATVKVSLMDSETTMPTICHSSVETWTDPPSTTDRSTFTVVCEKADAVTEMTPISVSDQGLQVKPNQQDMNTLTQPINMSNSCIQTDHWEPSGSSENRKSWHGGLLKLFKGKGSVDSRGSNDRLSSQSSLTEMLPPLSPTMVEASTETFSAVFSDKETNTTKSTTTDQWTETHNPVLVSTGISPPRPATIDSSVETNPLILMDQATHTETVKLKDSTTETTLVVQDNETLTERLKCQDAQTFVDLMTETKETSTDIKQIIDASVGTSDMLPESRSLTDMYLGKCSTPKHKSTNVSLEEFVQRVDTATNPSPPDVHDRGTMAMSFGQSSLMFTETSTQTSMINLFDKSIGTSRDFDQRPIEYCDMATSTESLPYIGLLSELEGDELFLIPESAFDLVSSEPSIDEFGDPIEMVDDYTSTDFAPDTETATQTFVIPFPQANEVELNESEVWKHSKRKDKEGKEIIDVGTNTLPKLTFEKETSTPIRHLFSKGTMTFYIAKSDKATSTFSNSRQIAENVFGNKTVHDTANKLTMTPKIEVSDASTLTETNSVAEGKMAACISKLQKVSQRLQSPTQKNMPDVPWKSSSEDQLSSKENSNDVIDATEQERQKNVQQLIAQSNDVGKAKKGDRKPQPITTLKGKTLLPPEESLNKSDILPRDTGGNETMLPGNTNNSNQMPRYNSAPGKIATVPNKKYKINQKQHNKSPSRIPVHTGSNTSLDITPVVKPKFPKATGTSRPSSTESESTASFISCNSDSSFISNDAKMDFSSLKINPNQTPSSLPKERGKAEEDSAKKPQSQKKASSSNVSFMQKLFSKKKKDPDPIKNLPKTHGKEPKQLPKANPPPDTEPMKPQKSKPFVYIRQKYMSIEHDSEEEKPGSEASGGNPRPVSPFPKKDRPTKNEVGKTTPKSTPKRSQSNRKSRPKSKEIKQGEGGSNSDVRPLSSYDNL